MVLNKWYHLRKLKKKNETITKLERKKKMTAMTSEGSHFKSDPFLLVPVPYS